MNFQPEKRACVEGILQHIGTGKEKKSDVELLWDFRRCPLRSSPVVVLNSPLPISERTSSTLVPLSAEESSKSPKST